jgi:hypothetical protein
MGIEVIPGRPPSKAFTVVGRHECSIDRYNRAECVGPGEPIGRDDLHERLETIVSEPVVLIQKCYEPAGDEKWHRAIDPVAAESATANIHRQRQHMDGMPGMSWQDGGDTFVALRSVRYDEVPYEWVSLLLDAFDSLLQIHGTDRGRDDAHLIPRAGISSLVQETGQNFMATRMIEPDVDRLIEQIDRLFFTAEL